MARAGVLLMVCVFVALTASSRAAEYYSSKYDNVNVDEILQNPRLRTQYLNCYLGKGPCLSPDARFLKDTFPEALVTRCRKCTEKQKDFFEKVTVWYTENEPDTWKEVVRKTIEDAKKKGTVN